MKNKIGGNKSNKRIQKCVCVFLSDLSERKITQKHGGGKM